MRIDNNLIFCSISASECERLIKIDGKTVKNYIRLKSFCNPSNSIDLYFVTIKQLSLLFGIGKSGCYKALTKMNEIGLVEAVFFAHPRGIPIRFLKLFEPTLLPGISENRSFV